MISTVLFATDGSKWTWVIIIKLVVVTSSERWYKNALQFIAVMFCISSRWLQFSSISSAVFVDILLGHITNSLKNKIYVRYFV